MSVSDNDTNQSRMESIPLGHSQSDQPTPFGQIADCVEADEGLTAESSVCGALRQWGPSLALLAAGFLVSTPDISIPLVGGGVGY